MFKIKINWDLPQGELLRRAEKLKKKGDVPYQKLLGFASRKAFTERRKTKKNLFCIFMQI